MINKSKKRIKHNFRNGAYQFFLVGILLCSVGCVPYDSLVNYSQSDLPLDQPQDIANYEPIRIQPNDILSIHVSSLDKELISVFNAGGGYLVSEGGMIDYPLVGAVSMEGLSISEAKTELVNRLQKYFVNPPIVNIHLANFKVNVNGEVGSPGNYVISNGRISLIDVITLAGDFTPYSSRDDVLIIREEAGKRIFTYVDFSNADIMNSPYFYLKQNDVIYVRPEKRIKGTLRGSSDRLLPYAQFALSFALIITTIFNLR